jgi:hypothetical protein
MLGNGLTLYRVSQESGYRDLTKVPGPGYCTVLGSNPGEEAKFSAPVQTDPGAHPVSYTKGTGPFPRVNQPGPGVDHPPHLAPRLKIE